MKESEKEIIKIEDGKGDYIIINKEDFDENKHKEYKEYKEKQEKKLDKELDKKKQDK